MSTYNDQLNFNESGIKNVVGNLEDNKNKINNITKEYKDYVNEQLAPNWTTDNGKESITKLNNFADQDLKNFEEYLQQQVNNLEDAEKPVSGINQA